MKKCYEDIAAELPKVIEWKKNGLSDKQIAINLGISYRTLSNYKDNNLQLLQALKVGKEQYVLELETALRKSALGYTVTEETKEVELNGDGSVKSQKAKKTVREVPPNSLSIQYALNNVSPEKWRNRKEISVETTNKTPPVTPDMIEAIFEKHRKQIEQSTATDVAFTDVVEPVQEVDLDEL